MKGGIKRYFGEKLRYPKQLQHSQTLHTFSDILVFVSVFVFIVVPVFVIIFVFSIFNMISITFCNILRGFSNLWRFWASISAIKYLTCWKATRQIMFSKMLTKSKESDRTPPYPIGKSTHFSLRFRLTAPLAKTKTKICCYFCQIFSWTTIQKDDKKSLVGFKANSKKLRTNNMNIYNTNQPSC